MNKKIIGGVLLVAGTTIGAGMLALPIVTGFAGFIPSLFLFIFYWIFMTYTALLMLEVNVSMEENTNLLTMVKNTLGKTGQTLAWFVYLFLLYALLTAYLAGSAPMILNFVERSFAIQAPFWIGVLPLFAFFGTFVYLGTRSVDLLNRLLMMGMALLFLGLIVIISPHVKSSLLSHRESSCLILALSVVATSFGFHIIIPTLRSYFHQDIGALKQSILLGSLIPLGVYIIWNFLTLGIIPLQGAYSIQEGLAQGSNGAYLLSQSLGKSSIGIFAELFSFLAIITSFLGVALSLFDFLADGCKIEKNEVGRLMLYGLTFLPPLIIVLTDPHIFIEALDYAGAFGVMILLGLFPPLMVWRLRYTKNIRSPYQAPGGKLMLTFAIALSLFIIGIEILDQTGYLRLFLSESKCYG